MIKNDSIELRCELCSHPTGTVLKLGDLIDKLPDLKPDGDVYLHGMCQKCAIELDEGCTFFCDNNRRVVRVSAEASTEKLMPEFRGKIVKIPVSAMSELLKAWANANRQPPESKN